MTPLSGPTPMTDAVLDKHLFAAINTGQGLYEVELSEHARNLERLLTEAVGALIEIDRWSLTVGMILDSTSGWQEQKQSILNALGEVRATFARIKAAKESI